MTGTGLPALTVRTWRRVKLDVRPSLQVWIQLKHLDQLGSGSEVNLWGNKDVFTESDMHGSSREKTNLFSPVQQALMSQEKQTWNC